MNDNQLMPGGDQGMTPSAQALGLPLATNRTVNVGPPPSLISVVGPITPGFGDWKKGRPRKAPGSPHPIYSQCSSWYRADPKASLPLGFQTYRGLQLTSGLMSLSWEGGGTEDQQRWVLRG